MGVSRRSVVRAGGAAAVLGAGGAFAYGQLSGATDASEPTALVAGSLLRVCTATPGASVEAHGSAAVRRLVVEGLREPDAVALADPRLFDGVSDRATFFATNALVLAYDPASSYADDLRNDWRRAITADGVQIGRTDPDQDPLGYRTVMALELAERRYGIDADAVLGSSTVFRETDLLNVVEQGGVDAAVVYRSMAVERGYDHRDLPAAVDLSDPAHADAYAKTRYTLPDGKQVTGGVITYGATRRHDTPGATEVFHAIVGGDYLSAHGFVVPSSYPAYEGEVPDDVR